MHYTVYKITHIESGKVYIGKHQTNDLDDGYMGSGKHLRRAIAKHGIENFEKEILHVFDDEASMNLKEAELVTEEFCDRKDTYNLCPGGHGGFGYLNSHENTREWRAKGGCIGGKKAGLISIIKLHKLLEENPEIKQKRTNSIIKSNVLDWTGKKHKESSKIKIGRANSKYQSGAGNSQYGTCWIHSLEEKRSMKIKKEDLEEWTTKGWLAGRKMKF